MVAYIDEHREDYGVEPICKELPIAPATYRRHKNRGPSRREQDDQRLAAEVARVFEENYRVYGRRKVWAQLNREGVRIGRDRTEGLMRSLGIAGAVRGRRVRTTRADSTAPRAPDLVDRDWAGIDRPNAVWVSDVTYVATSTRPNSSAAPDPGGPSTPSRSPPSSTSTGSTTAVSTARSA
jgi:hypothetical protein